MNNFYLKDKAFEQLLKSKFKTFENEFQATCEMQYNDAGSIIVNYRDAKASVAFLLESL